MTRTGHTILANSLLAFVCLSAAQARAEEPGPTLRIPYSSWELSTQASAEALYKRIQRGARKSCATQHPGSVIERMAVRQCRKELVGLAVAKLNSPIVTAVHNGDDRVQFATRK